MNSTVSLLLNASYETLYMVVCSIFFAVLFGFPMGIGLFFEPKKKKSLGLSMVYKLLNYGINATRSIPFIILLILLIPITRLIVGSSIGTTAAIVPLSLGAAPFIARIVESSLNEVPAGIIEAAKSMGASSWVIVSKVLVWEALPSLIRGLTLTLISLIGYSAMAGAIGGGGLGDLAIRYGYQRFDSKLMFLTTLILIVLVQGIQSLGDYLAQHYDRRTS